ncbi:MAG TPA: hypothetical protein VLH56_18955 [Dissulfurispiraceae bacterium]|nr:hypothetical protein [Dissulfurispiraceae bacterium]
MPIEDVGLHGVNKDVPTRLLSPGAWTDVRNMHFRDGYVEKAPGSFSLFQPAVVPYALFPAPYNGTNFWSYFGKAKAYGFVGLAAAEITRAAGDYTGAEYDLWLGGLLNGIPFFTNGVDVPQVWAPPALGTPLIDLPNWPANTSCKVLRAYKEYLVALDVTKNGARDRRLIKWSNPAEPGTLPNSWDETNPANDAGEKSLSEGVDVLLDCLPLGETNVLYLESSTWGMRYSGGSFIFDFHRIFEHTGLLAAECVRSLRGQHIVVTQDDVILHDGVNVQSIMNGRLRRWFFRNINASAYFLTKLVPLYKNQEMWLCFPKDSGVLDTALVWNWGNNTWTIIELPNVRAITSSLYSPIYDFDLWDTGQVLRWDEENVAQWGDPARTRFQENLLFSPEDTSGLRKQEAGVVTADGVAYRSYVERTGLCYTGLSRDGKPQANPTTMKNSLAIWPRIEAAEGSEFLVYVGSQMCPDGAITWADPVTFTVGVDIKVDVYITGRLYSVRFEATNAVAWKLTGYDAEVNEVSIN